MSLELRGELLGLGSIVRLENERVSGLFVILARGAYRADNERPEVEPRYLVAPHPYGEAPDQETFPVLAREVQEIVFEGYSDDADVAFLTDLLDQMENGRRATRPAPQFTDALTEIPEVHAPHPTDQEAVALGVDPFSDLRRAIDADSRKGEK